VIINNNGAPEATWAQVRAAWSRIQGAAEEEAVQAQVQRVQVKPSTAAAGKMAISSLDIMRGMPRNAELIARLLYERTGRMLTRNEVLMAFGQKSYMLAMVNSTPVGLIGFLVENLITRVDEFIVTSRAPVPPVAAALIEAMERASRELQSEVGYVFLPDDENAETVQAFLQLGYEKTRLEEIKVPAWREAAREAQPAGTQIFAKKLREQRVFKPI